MEVVKAGSGKGKKGHAETAIDYIRELYAIEKKGREKTLTREQLVELREEKSKPIVKELEAFLNRLSGQTPPKGLLGESGEVYAEKLAFAGFGILNRGISHRIIMRLKTPSGRSW